MGAITFGDTQTLTVTMDSNLSSKEGYAVNLDTTDEANVNLAAGATLFPFPLLDCGDGSAAKVTGSVAYGGRVKVKLGGTVAPGDKLTSDGNGKWVATVTDKQHYGAIALTVGADGDLAAVIVERGLISAT